MDKQIEIEQIAKILDEADEVEDALYVNFHGMAKALVNAGYRLCGGDNCPNFKHYQAECERCTKKMEIKKSFEIDAIKQQAVREFAEKLKSEIKKNVPPSHNESQRIYNLALEDTLLLIDRFVKEVCGE